MEIIERTKKHWLVGIIIVASISGGTAWQIANAILVDPRNFTIAQQEKSIVDLARKIDELKSTNEILERKIEELRGHNSNSALMVNIAKDWEGIWLTTYKNGFSHKVEFKIMDDRLTGYYEFSNTKGEIIVNELTDRFLKAVWIQTINNKIYDSGDLIFTLQNGRLFWGTYSKRTENYKMTHSWDGKKTS